MALKKIYDAGVMTNLITNAQLTAVGQTTAVDVEGFLYHTYSVNSVENTSTDVRYQIEGTLDGSNWFVLIPTNAAITGYTVSNGLITVTVDPGSDTSYVFQFLGKFKEMRFNWITETGDTDAVIDVLEIHGT